MDSTWNVREWPFHTWTHDDAQRTLSTSTVDNQSLNLPKVQDDYNLALKIFPYLQQITYTTVVVPNLETHTEFVWKNYCLLFVNYKLYVLVHFLFLYVPLNLSKFVKIARNKRFYLYDRSSLDERWKSINPNKEERKNRNTLMIIEDFSKFYHWPP